jgi:peptide deformylase
MALLKVARMGHPVLARAAEPVTDPRAPEIRRLIADMAETMLDLNAAGIAAPQVHAPLRVVMFRVTTARAEREGADELPLTVLINPVLTPLGDEMAEDWEGCLSVPGLRGLVPRHTRLRYRALDPEGGAIDRTVEGFHARVVQHECDHLEGKLYPQRMTDLSKLIFESEWRWQFEQENT